MSAARGALVDPCIAAYDDRDAAKVDWDTINQLADSGVIKLDGVVRVSRRLACRNAFRES